MNLFKLSNKGFMEIMPNGDCKQNLLPHHLRENFFVFSAPWLSCCQGWPLCDVRSVLFGFIVLNTDDLGLLGKNASNFPISYETLPFLSKCSITCLYPTSLAYS